MQAAWWGDLAAQALCWEQEVGVEGCQADSRNHRGGPQQVVWQVQPLDTDETKLMSTLTPTKLPLLLQSQPPSPPSAPTPFPPPILTTSASLQTTILHLDKLVLSPTTARVTWQKSGRVSPAPNPLWLPLPSR